MLTHADGVGEFFLLFSSIARYEAALEALLSRFAALLVLLVLECPDAKPYVAGYAVLLQKLAVWFAGRPLLTYADVC